MTPIIIASLLFAQGTAGAPIQVADFSDAYSGLTVERLSSSDSQRVPGTQAQGISPNKPTVLNGLKVNPLEGTIEVWVKPSWAGSDGKKHTLWQTNEFGGRQVTLEKSERGMLRVVIRTPDGATVARTDVSAWKAGTWHQLAFGWTSQEGRNVGTALWVDKVAVDGPITPYGVFDKGQLPTSLSLGDTTGGVVFDELIVRPDLKGETPHGMISLIYRDYFRGAPCEAIKVDLNSTRVPSDARAIAGFEKQLGLQMLTQGKWEPITENVVRYGQWAYFDAKPLIKWTTSDPSIASLNADGRLMAHKTGKCLITATFRGKQTTYPLTVIGSDKPDLGVINIELLPRYRSDAVKDRFAVGEMVTAKIHFGNFGRKNVEPGAKIVLEWVPDSIRNYRVDASEKATSKFETTYNHLLKPGEEAVIEVEFPFPAQSTWMRLKLDPENKIDELCEANNTIDELTDARPIKMGYRLADLKKGVEKPLINHVGSFSYYDWLRAEKLRMDVMLREAVYPTTSPDGVREAYRIDSMIPLTGVKWEDEEYSKTDVDYDGGFPVNEPVDLMAIDCAIIHEFGHCILSQPDLYGYPTSVDNVLLTDSEGKFIAGTPVLPKVNIWNLPASPGVNIPSYVGYPSLMDGCQLWLHPSQAGHVEYYKGYRPDRFWGTQGRLIPTRANWLMLTDLNDLPLKNAAVYIYHVTQASVQDSGAKFFADRPKFMGNADAEGRYILPNETDADWDDPLTDEVDGTVPVWNPFGTAKKETAFTPNVWEVEGLLLLKIVSNGKFEYQFMDLTQFNIEFLSGHKVFGKYSVRTSLASASKPEELVRKPVPDAIKKVNKAPVAVAPKELTVKCGEEFVIDGSKSYDPENQPLIFRWDASGTWLAANLSHGSSVKLKAPDQPGEKEYKLWVLDGVRSSEAIFIKVKFVK